MWDDSYTSVCRTHRAVLAAYESPRGDLALLLRRPIQAPAEGRRAARRATRRVVRRVVMGLRAAGFRGEVSALQGRPLIEVARVVDRWTCRYVAGVVRLPSAAPSANGETPRETGAPAVPADRLAVAQVARWYESMASTWLATEPVGRRQLILAAHRWIVESVLAPIAEGDAPLLDDLRPGGALTRRLVRAIPPEEASVWKPWVALVVADLDRALRWPVARRGQDWLRWLFLIPYSIPVSRRSTVHRAGVAAPARTPA